MPIPPISITTFGGEVPAADDRLLPDNAAALAINTWLFSGRIEPVHSLQPIHTMSSLTMRSWFRKPSTSGLDYMGEPASKFLEFENEDVRVIRSPTPGQTEGERFYWADGIYPKVITGDMIDADDPPFALGVPDPPVAPSVTASGGVSSVNVTVTYVYTWVTSLGEEGPPSPPTTITAKVDDTYHVTVVAPTPPDTDNRDITHWRLYRTIVSAQGVAIFYFVVEQTIATLTYDDNHAVATDAVIVNNEQLPSLLWTGPPADLLGLVTMGNGMIAGWRANEVWFCEPYRPHAWPIIYVIAVDATIVGLGVFNQSLIILTDGQPYAATGIRPDAMTLSKIQPLEACTSRRSIVNTPNGVLYSSPNGLINITPQGATNLTLQTVTKDEWNNRLNLPSLMATVIAQLYYCYSGPTAGVFQKSAFQNDAFQMTSATIRPGALISLVDPRIGYSGLITVPSQVINLMTDIFNGETMILRDNIVYHVDLRSLDPFSRYRWRSKVFTLPYLQNLGAAKVYWTPAQGELTDPLDAPSIFRVYAGARANKASDGLKLRFAQEMTKSGQMFRLPSGFKAQYYQFEVEGSVLVNAIHCAQTPHELRHI